MILQRIFHRIMPMPAGHPQAWLFVLLALAILGSMSAAFWLEEWLLMGVPAALLVAWLAVVDFKRIFFLMLGCMPVSVEMYLPGGFGTDMPTEPLMWTLTLISLLWFARNWRSIDGRYLRHPLTLLLLLHLCWMTVTVVLSEDFIVSFKFLLAKGWYVIVFYFLAGRLLQQEKDFKNLVWWYYVPLFVTVVIVTVRHAAIGFSFEEVNYVMGPFYRNHVMYACLLAFFLPFTWYATYWYRRGSFQWLFLVAGVLLFLVGINFAYTRAAYVALVVAVGAYWVIRWRLMKAALVMAVLLLTLLVALITYRDNWLEFAPDFTRTVTHKEFDNLLEATTKLEDISIMERVYRWVAASYMIQDKPFAGFGPGTFYFYYKDYTVTSFQTYVSHNPERSGMHNYYLMTCVEQGLPGLVFFLAFCFFVMLRGETIYHQTRDAGQRRFLVASLLCFILIDLLMLMNDFVETDKVGSLFFMCVAIVVNTDLRNRDAEEPVA